MINIIIFSKDRACQLDLLLRSLRRRFKLGYTLSVLYTYSNDNYKEGYVLVKNIWSRYVYFKKELNFKEDLINMFLTNYKFTLYLTDDNFFTKDVIVDGYFKLFEDSDIFLALSLLKSRNNKYLYDNSDRLSYQPEWIDDIIWNWKKSLGIWNYCMSLATNIYNTEDLRNCITKLPFTGPNTLEDLMVANPINKKYMVGSSEIKVVTLDANKVYKGSNIQFDILQEESMLNDKWLDGYRIKNTFEGLRNNLYVFRKVIFEFEKRI